MVGRRRENLRRGRGPASVETQSWGGGGLWGSGRGVWRSEVFGLCWDGSDRVFNSALCCIFYLLLALSQFPAGEL